MFTFKNIREELYHVNTFVKNSNCVMKLFRSPTLYNELSFDLFTFASNANNNLQKKDIEYFKENALKKYHTIRMIHVFEYNCLIRVLKDPNFQLQGMTIDYEKKRLYFDSFEIALRSIFELYKRLVLIIPDLRYGLNQYIENFGFVSMNYTAINALIES